MLHLLPGLAAGCAITLQSGANARLRRSVGSPLFSALISFAIGTAALVAVVLLVDGSLALPAAATDAPWWIWTGGLLGAFYVAANAALAPVIGTGMTVVLTLLGMTAASVALDHFGLLGTRRRPTTPLRLVGLLVLVAGVATIRML